jgi:DNA-directed RNA polymerase specialized sigma24 family protein
MRRGGVGTKNALKQKISAKFGLSRGYLNIPPRSRKQIPEYMKLQPGHLGHLTPIQAKYLHDLRQSLCSIYGQKIKVPQGEVEDIVSFLIVRTARGLTSVMKKYPEPSAYARVIYKNGAVDFARRQAVSRGEGSRYSRTVDSVSVIRGRSGASFEESLTDIHNDDFAQVDSRIDSSKELKHALSQLSSLMQKFLYLTAVCGLTQAEAAHHLNHDRSYLSRKLKSDLAMVRKTFGAAS